MSLETQISALGYLETVLGSMSEQPGASSWIKECFIQSAYKRGSVGAQAIAGESTAWQRQAVQAREDGHCSSSGSGGRGAKEERKGWSDHSIFLVPHCAATPTHEGVSSACHALSPLSLEAHWITVCSPVYPPVHQKCIALCIDLERKKNLLF